MGRSTVRVNNLKKVLQGGHSELLNEIAALGILFEDLKIEISALRRHHIDTTETVPAREAHLALYYVRRCLITVDEVRERLQRIQRSEEYRAKQQFIGEHRVEAIRKAHSYLTKNDILKRLRNRVGAHLDTTRTVKAALEYYDDDAMSAIRSEETQTDFGLGLDYATHLLIGGMASSFPGGIEQLPEALKEFYETLLEAFGHVCSATYILTHDFIWEPFGSL